MSDWNEGPLFPWDEPVGSSRARARRESALEDLENAGSVDNSWDIFAPPYDSLFQPFSSSGDLQAGGALPDSIMAADEVNRLLSTTPPLPNYDPRLFNNAGLPRLDRAAQQQQQYRVPVHMTAPSPARIPIQANSAGAAAFTQQPLTRSNPLRSARPLIGAGLLPQASRTAASSSSAAAAVGQTRGQLRDQVYSADRRARLELLSQYLTQLLLVPTDSLNTPHAFHLLSQAIATFRPHERMPVTVARRREGGQALLNGQELLWESRHRAQRSAEGTRAGTLNQEMRRMRIYAVQGALELLEVLIRRGELGRAGALIVRAEALLNRRGHA